jgi:serine/arginine repetitive matrix protein 2
MDSVVEGSPCGRIEKRKHSDFKATNQGLDDFEEVRSKARIVEKPSIASTSSESESPFGGERVIKPQRGLIERQSLEDSVLIGSGEDLSSSCTSFRSAAPDSPI